MASRKSPETLDRETSQRVTLRSQLADMAALLAERDATVAALREEISRKEAVLRSTQQWLAKYKGQAQARTAAPSERRAAMDAAKAAAMAGGKLVSVQF